MKSLSDLKQLVNKKLQPKPAPEPAPVIAGMKAEPLGILQDEPEPLRGDARVRFLSGAVANQRSYSAGDEATLPVEDARLLKADGKAEILTLLPPKEEEPHPYRGAMTRKLMARMMGAARGAGAAADWVRAPLGRKFAPFRW